MLVRLSDPEAPPPVDTLSDVHRLTRLLTAADRHGVTAIVIRKFLAARPERESKRVLESYETQLIGAVGRSMLLRRQAKRILERFAKAGLRVSVVKGPVFADLLYSHGGDRPFTDIDFLVPVDRLGAANALMSAMDFTRPVKAWNNSRRDLEYKWLLKDDPSILVEVHGDLVHYPRLRRRISFGFDRLAAVEDGVANRPAALLMTAVVHAACGHKFRELSHLVDVLQGVRRLQADESERFVRACSVVGATLEAGVTLDLVGRLFEEPRACELAACFDPHWAIRVGQRLINADAVLGAHGRLGPWLRRHAFRQLQQVRLGRP